MNEVDDPEYEIPEILLVSIHFLAEIDIAKCDYFMSSFK